MKPDDPAASSKEVGGTTTGDMVTDQDAPDPDEGDLDDLDDLLDEFSTTKTDDSKILANNGDQKQVKQPPPAGDTSEDAAEAFNKQLREQMAALMGSMDDSPEMKKEMEAIVQGIGSVAGTEAFSESGRDTKSKPTASGAEEPFQKTIRKTMERMQTSGEQATAAARTEDSQDVLAQMMKEMQTDSLEGAGGEEGFNKMLMGMMEQLTDKEILYEPMKELHDNYPAWLDKNKPTVSADDMRRYTRQQKLVQDIVGRFEKKNYSDENAEDRKFIVERMQQMQSEGNPPADLVGDMMAAQDAIGDLDSGCNQQ